MTAAELKDEIKFLRLLRNKVNLTIKKVSIREPLIEIKAMIDSRIDELTDELADDGRPR